MRGQQENNSLVLLVPMMSCFAFKIGRTSELQLANWRRRQEQQASSSGSPNRKTKAEEKKAKTKHSKQNTKKKNKKEKKERQQQGKERRNCSRYRTCPRPVLLWLRLRMPGTFLSNLLAVSLWPSSSSSSLSSSSSSIGLQRPPICRPTKQTDLPAGSRSFHANAESPSCRNFNRLSPI